MKSKPNDKSHLLALEPRMMFDGAGVVTAIVAEPVPFENPPEIFSMDNAIIGVPGMDMRIEAARLGALHLGLSTPGGSGAMAGTDTQDVEPDAEPHDGLLGVQVTTSGSDLESADAVPDANSVADSDVDQGATDYIFINTDVENYQQLAAEWEGRGTIVFIDGGSDGIDQILAALAGQSDIGAIHLVSHGDDGMFWLGDTLIDAAAVNGELAEAFALIGSKLSIDGDILIYGCDVGYGAEGQALLDSLALVTDADIAASIDDTGSILRGGDWTLENRLGTVEAASLVAREWDGLLAPSLLRTNGIVVRDAGGNVVGTNTSLGAGGSATYANVATVNGQQISMRATIVNITNGDTIRFSDPGDDFGVFLISNRDGLATAEIRWDIFFTATGAPANIDIGFTVADIDGVGGQPRSREFLTIDTDTLSSFQASNGSNLVFDTTIPGEVTASGTQNENGATRSAGRFNWLDTNSFTINYNLANVTSGAFFRHDGDADFNLGNGGATVSIPRLDLDGNNSTAPGSGYAGTFVENGNAVGIVDNDVRITNPDGTVERASITLTNAQAGDRLLVNGSDAATGNLAGGITYTRTATEIILTGAATDAQYTNALQAITFESLGERPDETPRTIDIAFENQRLGSNVATATINVVEVNDPPTAVNDPVQRIDEDTGIVSLNVLGNDSDGDGDPLTVISANAGNGTVTINGDGTLNYTPNANYNGNDTITYTISDGRGGTSTATVPIVIDAVNDQPTTVGNLPPQTNIDAQQGISVNVSGGFTDVEDSSLTYSAVNLPAGLSIDAGTGVITGTIDNSASQGGTGGVYSVTVTATDSGGLSTTQTFSWSVTNPPPQANDDGGATNEDTPATINVLANDQDPDGDAPLTVVSASAPNGTVVINADGTLTYTPNANFNGNDVITYTISDGEGGTDTAVYRMTVVAVNDAPTAQGQLSPQTNLDADSAISVQTSGGFADVDDTALQYSANGLPAGLSIDAATGEITGTIDNSASQVNGGNYTITVTATDSAGQVATQSFAWTVTNPAPTAADDTATVAEDAPATTITVLGNDNDPDGDDLTVTSASAPNGTVTINPDGTLEYTPNADFNGTDTISYTISDGEGGTSSAVVTITVDPVNDAPVADPIAPQTNVDDASVNVPVAGSFSDPEGGTLTYSASGLPAGLSIDMTTGEITGTIDRSASQGGTGGVYAVTVTATDTGGLSVDQTFNWTVTNPAPIAVDDTATTTEDTPVLIDVLPNDSDPDGDPLAVISAFASVGQATLVGNQINFVPPANFNGTATITYQISDGEGGTATATVEVTVTPENDAPTAAVIPPQDTVDSATISVPVAGSFSDVDGDALTFTAADLPPGLTIDATTGVISGTITNDASQTNGGVYTATITADDGNGGTVSQTVTFNVTNPGPVASDDSASTDEDTPVNIPVLANDNDPDGDPLTVTSADAQNGTVVIEADGTITYTPNSDFNGTDTITYEISDGNGGTSIATVTVTVNDINDVPVTAGAIGDQSNLDAQNVSLPVAGAFSDPDGDTLSYTATGLPAGLTIDAATGVISGTIDNSASQVNGGSYTIEVTASDGRGGTVSSSFTWDVANPAPIASNDAVTTAEDTAVNVPVLANDTDPDGDDLTVTVASAGNGTVAINADGSLLYTPNADFNGTDTIVYTITDGEGGTSSASVDVTVTPVNDAPTTVGLPNQNGEDAATVSVPTATAFTDVDGDDLSFGATGLPAGLSIDPDTGLITGTLGSDASQNGPFVVTVTATDPSGEAVSTSFIYSVQNVPPIAVNDTATTPEDTPVTVAVLTNDSDPDGDPLMITSASADTGTVVVNADGTLTFTPDADFNGQANVTYTVSDGQGGVATATLTVDVAGANDAPEAVDIPDVTNEDNQSVSIATGSFFSDVDGDALTITAAGLPAGLTIDTATGIISGTIDRDASQGGVGGVYTVTLTADDGNGETVSQDFTWTVTNPAPTAVNDNAATDEDTPVNIPVIGNDTDPDGDDLTVTTATAPNGTVVIEADGTLTYTPNANFNGSDTITYSISDGNGGTSTAAVTVTVAPVNDPPVAVDDAVTTDEDTPVTIGVLGNDSDLDGDTLTVTAATSADGTVTINADGTLEFTPNANFNGTATISYTIDDGNGGTGTATVTVTVNPINDPPVANPDSATTDEDTLVNIPLIGNDTDADNDALTVTVATAPNGNVTINADGSVDYTPNADFNGTDTITYTISDGNGGFSTSTATVTVDPVNDAPVATPIAPQANDDATPVTLDVSGNFSDVDNDPLTFTAAGLPIGLSIDANGVITGTLDPSASQGGPLGDGVYTVTVTADDGNGGTVDNVFTWTVANPAPVAANDTATTDEDTPVNIPVLANDNDPDGDDLTVTGATAASGTVVIEADGTLTYTPNADFNGTDTITYTIDDGEGGTSTATVTVTVDPVNDAPVATNIGDQNDLDADTVSLDVGGNFTDIDGDALSFTAAGLPAGLSIDANGLITGTIDREASQVNGGVYSVTVTADDGNGGTVSTTFAWTVTNPAPTAADDTATTDEDTPVNIPVLGNDNDPDGDPLSVISATAPNGTVVVEANGTVTYTPNANFNGTDTITYTISDGNGGTDTATVTVTVDAVNDAPTVATPLPNLANEDSNTVTVPTAGNFTDLDGDMLTFTAIGLPAGLSIGADGIITGTIDPSASQGGAGGVYTITVTADDGNGGTVDASFTWTITNPPPVAADDTATTTEDTAVNIPVLANDNDPDGDTLTVTSGLAANGSVVIEADGTITYTPNADFNGTDTITYTISDGEGGASTATVTVTVDPANDIPVADPQLTNQNDLDADAVSVDVSGNFTDVDGDTLAFTATGLPGGLSIDANGLITGTLDADASQGGPNSNGLYTVTVTADDGNGGTASSSFVWTVGNPPPVAADDTATTDEDVPVTVTVLANDNDPDGDALTVTAAAANNGTVLINADGTITYTPNANFNGTDTVVYTISDGEGGTATANVTITVDPINDAPETIGLPDLTDGNNEAITVGLASAFSDAEDAALTYAATGLPDGLSIDPATGEVTGTTTATASSGGPGSDGIYTVTIEAEDSAGLTVSTTFTWTINNQPPTAVNDTYNGTEDTVQVLDVLTNDNDPDGNAGTPIVIINAQATNGTAVVNGDGTITFTPDADFNGIATVTYTIEDANGDPASAVATINIAPVNDAPAATNLPDRADEDGDAISIDAGTLFSDIEGDTLTFSAANLPAGLSIDMATGLITGTIDPDASQLNRGIYQTTITADDGNGGTTDITFVWTVTNPGPTAADDTATVTEDTPSAPIDVLGNDVDPDGDDLTVVLATAPNGTVVINGDGTLTYTPDANFNGTDTITYQIDDGQGGTSTANVVVTVTAENDAPTAPPIGARSNLDADGVSVDLSGGFADEDGDALTFTATGLPTGLSIDAAGNVTGTIDAAASQGGPNGDGIFQVTITADDGNGGTVDSTFTWSVTNPPPVAVNDGPVSTDEDTPVDVDVLANDNDPDGDPLTVTVASAANGTVTIGAGGVITYTPDANFNGTDTVTYTISDGNGGTSTATVAITVDPVNDDPTATQLSPLVNQDSDAVSVATAGNFADLDGDTLTFTATDLPSGLTIDMATGVISGTIDADASQLNGGVYSVTVTADDGNGGTVDNVFTWTVTNPAPIAADDTATTAEDTLTNIAVLANDNDPDGDALTVTTASAANGTVTILPDGTIDYTPNADFNGTDTISYTISDGNGGTDTATVTVTVDPENDPPVAVNDAASTDEDTPVNIALLGNDSDIDGDTLTVTSATAPNGTVVIEADGTVTYTPNADFNGTDTITYEISDGNGGTDTATITVVVAPVNDAPVAVVDTATTPEDTPVTIPVLGNDSDVDGDPLTVTTATSPDGTVTINPDGTVTFTPNANFNGPATITYEISDGNGGTATTTVTVNVAPVNDPPVAVDDSATTDEDTPVTVTVLANDSDVDGDMLTVTTASAPNGTVVINANGTVEYTPNADFNGTDIVTYTISDGNGGTDTATITVTVNPVNDPPVAVGDVASGTEDQPLTIPLLGNDSDVDGDPLTVTTATSPDGTVTINPDGTVTFVPNPNFNGPTTISYEISDGNGGTDTAVISVDIAAVNDAPVAVDDVASTPEDTPVTITPLANDSDVDGDPLTVVSATAPNGTVTINPDGTVEYTPNANFNGTDTITYQISDGMGGTDTATITVMVGPVNDAPVADNDTATTDEDTPVNVPILANDSDPEGDPLTVTTATAPNGTVVIEADGTVTYTPNPNFSGTDTITYEISDGTGGTATATVDITVNPINDTPDITPVADQDDVDAGVVSLDVSGNFSDIDGDPLTFAATGLPAGLTIDPATGVISGTIDREASQINGGAYNVTLIVDDGNGGVVTTIFVFNVTNPAPTAGDDVASTDEDTPVNIPVLTNDNDPDGDPLTVVIATAPNGTVVIEADGTLTYTPDANFNGTDTITYEISDGNGGIATATVAVLVNDINDTPVLSGAIGNQSNLDDQTVSLPTSGAFTDSDGDALNYTATGLPAGLTIDPATGVISGTIDNSASQVNGGSYTIEVTADDGRGGSISTTFTWDVANPAPVAANDTATTDEDTPVNVDVLANDNDPDGDDLTVTTASAGNGTVVIEADGTLTYTPNADFNGTDTIVYEITDSEGGVSTAVAEITITPVNDAPVTTGLPPQNGADGADVSIPIGSAFSDVDGDDLTFTAVGLPDALTLDPVTGVISGTLAADSSQNGPFTVTVTATDPSGAAVTATFVYSVQNVPPVAVNDTASTPEDTPVTVSVLTNDSDPDGDPLTITSASADNGTVVVNPDGTVTFTPNDDFNGVANVTYTVSDGNGGIATATLTVDVGAVNDAPVAVDIPDLTNEDSQSVSVPTGSFFSDLDGDALSITAAGLPAGLTIDPATGVISGTIDSSASIGGVNGVYTVTLTADDGNGGTVSQDFTWTVTNPAPTAVNDNASTDEDTPVNIAVLPSDTDPDGDVLTVTTATASNGTVTIEPDGTVTYTPDANFNGSDTIIYTISDGNGGSSTAAVDIVVNPVNDLPVAVDDVATTDEDSPVTIGVLDNGTDVDGDPLTVTTATSPNGTVVINPNGTITFTPAPNFTGTAIITYEIDDGNGGTATATATVTVNPVNDRPVAVDDVSTTPEETPVTVNVLANDSDPDGDPLTITAAASPDGNVVINPDGTITFTPNTNFTGPATITYTVRDGNGGVATATVTVDVTPVNDPPVAVNDNATTLEDTPLTISPLTNDSDVDGDPLTIASANAPNGTVTINPDGSITYVPNADFNGTDTITYQISDGNGGFATATITVTVNGANDDPIAVDDVAAVENDMSVNIPVLDNDSDPENDPLTVVSATAPNGTVVIEPDGTITYTPDPDFVGTETITYVISDGNGGTATATVIVEVTEGNADPIDEGETVSVIGGVETVINVLDNASDPDGDPLSVVMATADVGTVVINPDGTLTYVAPIGFGGTATISYTISDGNGGFVTSTVTIEVVQAGADVNALLGIDSRTGLPDGGPIDRNTGYDGTTVDTPMVILDAVNGFRSLGGLGSLDGDLPLLTAVNNIRSLNGIGGFDVNGHPIDDVSRYIDHIRDLRFGLDRLFDPRFGDFIPETLTGFSVRQLDTGTDQIMIESIVRDRIMYVEIKDIGAESDPRMVEYQLLMRDGSALPDWVRMDARGLAIIEKPLDADALRLIVRAIRADGQVIDIPVVIQGATGEIQLDKAAAEQTAKADTLGASMARADSKAVDEASELLAAFNG